MILIDSALTMARARTTLLNPWLRRRLTLLDYRLGPVVVVESGDTLSSIEAAAGLPIATNLVDGLTFPDGEFVPSWEWCEADHGWFEIGFITADDGSGAVVLVPDRDGVDPILRAIIRTFGT